MATDTTIEFRLSKPLATHKGPIGTLTLRSPRAATLFKAGSPYSVVFETSTDGTFTRTEIRHNAPAMKTFISDMSGIDPVILEDLDAADAFALFGTVVAVLGSRPTPSSNGDNSQTP